jgi:hypothetical protein
MFLARTPIFSLGLSRGPCKSYSNKDIERTEAKWPKLSLFATVKMEYKSSGGRSGGKKLHLQSVCMMHPHLADGIHRCRIRRSGPRHLGAKSWMAWRIASTGVPASGRVQSGFGPHQGSPLYNHFARTNTTRPAELISSIPLEWTGIPPDARCIAQPRTQMQACDSLSVPAM